ncbi:hypothetical protein KEM52_005688 [Ascosphaera acerosa]|nr:hypothetical protein KEM52_005688 [Ascosphaera acerosa]
MATIKPIEGRSVHLIQSGQVIVDLCSVVKELIENSLDAGATNIGIPAEIRLKNSGLASIEVQDNGAGIAPEDYESVALKHYTSKLETYDDISQLRTFGFRGEALSSLCALSDFRITTAQAAQAPKASRLHFEPSGTLKSVQVVAGQKGTTATVEDLFARLPVRRKELEKNIKREYVKLVTLLQAYACISTGVRFSVRSQMPRGKNVLVFATHGNRTTRENISNVYGAKTVAALAPLDLRAEYKPSFSARRVSGQADDATNEILVRGHVSKPVVGEGRQTPDRQMFFVNGRPCALPQMAKAFNEAYKAFNVSQSPFVLADFQMDTTAYDVNVSPDKRTILLHDAGAVVESIKESLSSLFESLEQTVPHSQPLVRRASSLQAALTDRRLDFRPASAYAETMRDVTERSPVNPGVETASETQSEVPETPMSTAGGDDSPIAPDAAETLVRHSLADGNQDEEQAPTRAPDSSSQAMIGSSGGFKEQGEQSPSTASIISLTQSPTRHPPGPVPAAHNRMRTGRVRSEVAEITVGETTVQSRLDEFIGKRKRADGADDVDTPSHGHGRKRKGSLTIMQKMIRNSLSNFRAPGTRHRLMEFAGMDEAMVNADGMEDGSDDEGDATSTNGTDTPEEAPLLDGNPQSPEQDVLRTPASGARRSSPHANGFNLAKPSIVDEIVDVSSHGHCSIDQSGRSRRQPRGRDSGPATPSRRSPMSSMPLYECSIAATCDGISAHVAAFEPITHPSCDTATQKSTLDADHLTEPEDQAVNRFSLTVTKEDFSRMKVVGQFNLGFILAVRPGRRLSDGTAGKDELFIIDQHASDEKYNFERLQAETVVQTQRLVRPKILDLTAVEEETIIDNLPMLEKNGFVVDVDTSGDEPIGNRCKLVSLPLSKEVVFGLRDLEELIVLLSETPSTQRLRDDSDCTASTMVPRPSKVRKMFAMRACRSSIMIGRPLTIKQMDTVVRHMGTIDKPWNCPHGRPTMRHLMTLDSWDVWDEYADRVPVCENIGGAFDT